MKIKSKEINWCWKLENEDLKIIIIIRLLNKTLRKNPKSHIVTLGTSLHGERLCPKPFLKKGKSWKKKKTNGTCKTLMSSQGKECKSNKRREAKSKPKGNQALHFWGCISNQRFFGETKEPINRTSQLGIPTIEPMWEWWISCQWGPLECHRKLGKWQKDVVEMVET